MSAKDRKSSPKLPSNEANRLDSTGPTLEPVVTTLDAALALARTSAVINDADGQPFELIEHLDGYVLSECVIPEQWLADIAMRCEVAVPGSDGFICRGYMAKRDLLYRVEIAVRRTGAYELLEAELVAQILKPAIIEDVLARLSRS